MSNYRGIDLSDEIQDMFDCICRVKDSEEQRYLFSCLDQIVESINAKSLKIREAEKILNSL